MKCEFNGNGVLYILSESYTENMALDAWHTSVDEDCDIVPKRLVVTKYMSYSDYFSKERELLEKEETET